MSSKTTLADQLKSAPDRVDLREFAGGMPQESATLPQIRIGQTWWTTPQILKILVPAGLLAALGSVFLARWLRALPDIQEFILKFPGTGDFALPVHDGFPLWLRTAHWLNAFVMMFIIRSGIQILADHPRLYLDPGCTPGREWFRLRGPVPMDREWTAKEDSVSLPGWLGLPGIRHSVGLARWWHFSLDLVWLVNGLVFFALLFSTAQWQRIVPVSWTVLPHALSTALQYLSLDFPPPSGWERYNGLQMLAYFSAVFIASPLAAITGILQAPSIAARLHLATGWFNRQVARTLHFLVLLFFLAFVAGHVFMVFATDPLNNLNHMIRGMDDASWSGALGFALLFFGAAVAWLAASPLTLRYPRKVQHLGRAVVGWAYDAMEKMRPVAKYSEKDISPYFWVNGTHPRSPEFLRHLSENFTNYRLSVSGEVEHPAEFSMEELRAFPRQEQITQNYCIQGWSGIAKWGGVRLADIMKRVRPKPGVKYAVFYSFGMGSGPDAGPYYDCHKVEHLLHPQTILAYQMNGQPLTEPHGAPLRLRNELELGYKQVKWVRAIEFVMDFRHLGAGQGGFNEDQEYYGFRAPI